MRFAPSATRQLLSPLRTSRRRWCGSFGNGRRGTIRTLPLRGSKFFWPSASQATNSLLASSRTPEHRMDFQESKLSCRVPFFRRCSICISRPFCRLPSIQQYVNEIAWLTQLFQVARGVRTAPGPPPAIQVPRTAHAFLRPSGSNRTPGFPAT